MHVIGDVMGRITPCIGTVKYALCCRGVMYQPRCGESVTVAGGVAKGKHCLLINMNPVAASKVKVFEFVDPCWHGRVWAVPLPQVIGVIAAIAIDEGVFVAREARA